MAPRQYYRRVQRFARRRPLRLCAFAKNGHALSRQLRSLRCRSTVEFAMNYGTLPSRLLNAIDRSPNPRAQMFRRAEGWESISSEEFLRRIAGLSSAFVELGMKTGDRVAIFSANRPEWHTADFAITGAGGVSVPIYFNESSERITYILNHAEAKILFVAGAAQLAKLLEIRGALQHLEHIVVADAGSDIPPDCLRYETLIASAGGAEVAAYRLRASQ